MLRSRDDDPALTVGHRSRNRPADCYTDRSHNRPTGIVLRNGRFSYRRRVPTSLVSLVGKREIWRSLNTDSLSIARRRGTLAAAAVEQELEPARRAAGHPTDEVILVEHFASASKRATRL
ncbi:DUF6538 domain-containing protein [Sphingomonas sp. LHG3443-2]|uniref:DUF6538 domain-containing protein n=1 Tax=Sphingomonas sp. LHG3443-2 TaxID=2804639 RepID=UPI003CF98C45